jgi:hypothetical protein
MTTPIDPTELPASVLALVENAPVEDMLLAILRQGLPDIPIVSLIPEVPPPHFILTRRLSGMSDWSGDPRFTDTGRFFVHTYTQDPDGDWKGAVLSEAVRVVMRKAWLEHWNFPDFGSVIEIQMLSEPTRKTDWATSAGPVQYADLPTGYWRYESTYKIQIRKPRR